MMTGLRSAAITTNGLLTVTTAMAAAALVLPPTTPEGYHRIVSPTLTIPHDTNISIPVGLLACQRTVFSCYRLSWTF
jgi:hypothetical protein